MSSRVAMRRGPLSRLTPRERNLLGILALVFFIMGAAMLFTMRRARFDESRDRIAAMQRSLNLVYRQGAIYKEKLEEKQSRESELSTEKIQFTMLIEQAQTALENGTLRNEEEKPPLPVGDGDLVKRTYSFDLRSVRLDEMLAFLEKVETKPGHILYTDSLTVRSPSEVEDRLNAQVVLATWELKRSEPEEEASQ